MFWNTEIDSVTVITQMGNTSSRFKMLLVGKYMVRLENWKSMIYKLWYYEYHHLNKLKMVSANTGLQMHTYNKQSLMACIQPIFKVLLLFPRCPIFLPLPPLKPPEFTGALFLAFTVLLIALLVFHFLALCPSLCLCLSVLCYASVAIFHFTGKTGIMERARQSV